MPEVGTWMRTSPDAAAAARPSYIADRSELATLVADGRPHALLARDPRANRALPSRRGRRAIAILTSAVIVGAAFACWRSSDFFPDRDEIASALGFGIEQVSLTGHGNTADSEIFAALDLDHVRSLASFDPDTFRERLAKLPWVKSAEVTRIWPNQLAVRIEERKPAFVWERGSSAFLTDEAGGVLSPVARGAELDLPRIAGEGAPTEAAALFAALARSEPLLAKMRLAERVSGRRWTLHMRDSSLIHLPANGELAALARLNEHGLAGLLASPTPVILDLRSDGRIAVRSAVGATGARP